MKIRLLSFILLSIISLTVQAQIKKDTLSWNEYLQIVKQYHPVAVRAELLSKVAGARITQAWGNFEPKLSVVHDEKRFDGTEYYRFTTPEVKLPLWYGLELKGNYSVAEGAYINPEDKLPKEGLGFVGLNVSLGKGLLMDKRRAALKQARIFSESAENEQLRMLNDLILEAGEAYLNWQNQYQITEVYRNALQLTQVRFEAVKAAVAGGDRPAIDTIEALTQIQQRQLQFQQADLQLQNYFYELSSFLWLESRDPVDAEKLSVIPASGGQALLNNPEPAINNNPKLLSYRFKLQDLEIERRLKAENLRPTVDLQAGLLNRGSNSFRNLNADYFQSNNKIGLQIAFPLTFASGRGELREAKLKIRDIQLEESLVRNELEVKLNQNKVERKVLEDQLILLNQSLETNAKLLAGEETRFKLGDGSLFLINARESKLLEVREKLQEIKNKISNNTIKQAWLEGVIN